MSTPFLYEAFQFLIVTVLVGGCTLYCLLALAPNALKQGVKQVLLRCPLPAFIKAKLQQTQATGGCSAGCGACASGKAATTQPVKWHARQ